MNDFTTKPHQPSLRVRPKNSIKHSETELSQFFFKIHIRNVQKQKHSAKKCAMQDLLIFSVPQKIVYVDLGFVKVTPFTEKK